jgi:alanyl-tRNA synthetase
LGETATQAGSENSPGRFRFDFPATSAVPSSVMNEVENRVNELLISDLEVQAEVMSQAQAKAMGAMALFGEKYGDEVRVVSVGDWAKELCGGTHVSRSGQLGIVKLLSESSIGAGVRRVEALVGHDAYKYLAREHLLLNSLTEIIKGSRAEELPERVSDLIEKMKVMEKDLAIVRVNAAMESSVALVKEAKSISTIKFIVNKMANGLTAEELRSVALGLRGKVENAVVVLSSIVDSKVVLVCAVSAEANKLGVKAGELIKIGSTVLGGGGGGKDDFAQGGGISADKLDQAFAEIEKTINSKLK